MLKRANFVLIREWKVYKNKMQRYSKPSIDCGPSKENLIKFESNLQESLEREIKGKESQH